MGEESGGQEKDQSAEDSEGDQEYLDRSKLDFDPDDGLYTGTAVEGTSEIPGPHEKDAGDEPSGSDQQSGQDEDEQAAVDQ